MAPNSGVESTEAAATRAGAIAAIASYVIWGFFPILFHMLDAAGAATIVAHRTIWSLVLVGLILFLSRRLDQVRAALSNPSTLWRIAVSAILLAVNWLIYVYGVETNQVLETSFGYFINPLVNVALGTILLNERLTRWQFVSIAIAAVGIVLQWTALGGFPVIAISLALSFALYGYFRKTVKANSATGLFVETLLLTPVALGYLGYMLVTTGPGAQADPVIFALLVLTGPATSLTLLLFAFAVQRLSLTTIGMIQYIAPSIQFVLAMTLFGEELNSTRLVSFALIWLSLVVFTWDSVRRARRVRSHAAAA